MKSLKEKVVLITGAGGFIGSHLTERIAELGANVKVFLRYNSRNDRGFLDSIPESAKGKIEVIMGDLKDSYAVFNAMRGVDVVFHLGALIAIPYSYVNPDDVVETNIIGTMNVLNAARHHNVEKIINTSTSEVYGSAKYVPIDEKHVLQGQSPYSASKIGADKLAESYYLSFNLPVTTIRPFNTYGPRQSARAIIPTIITQAMNNDVIYLGALEPTRDLTFVKDTVEGFVKMALADNNLGQVVNVGSNFEVSIGDLARTIIKLLDKKIEIVSTVERKRPKKSEVTRLWADNTKAKELIGWTPQFSLEQGLKQTIDWVNENLKRYKHNIYNI